MKIIKLISLIVFLSSIAISCKKSTSSNNTNTNVCGTVTDADGNVYNTVKIGDQCWMKENLKTTKYNDGTAIPEVTNDVTWGNLTTGAYCLYENNAGNNTAYGKLYNWYAVNTGKLAPTGWHIPSAADWEILNNYLGGDSVSGGKMKATDTLTYWLAPNVGATNSSGFTALPGGWRDEVGGFLFIREFAPWWCTNSLNSTTANFMLLINSSDHNGNDGTAPKPCGMYIRCVKD